ncbi:hypothetical protein DFH09DRAFT_1077253 [Mycena vulgaris]|nr:hypothetical protein DFH09DRAFT_1077253 [Mycena vulgaris]
MAFRRTGTILAVISVAAGTETSSTLAPTLPTYETWTSIGCQRDSVQGRVLKHLVTLSNTTVEACLDACVVDNYALAGLEDGHECFCGNSILYDYPQPPTCAFPCAGNSSELCGGPESISLYQNAGTPFTIGNASVIETSGFWGFRLQGGGPSFATHGPKVPIPAEQMSIERCTDGCAAASFNTAGLERGQGAAILWMGNHRPVRMQPSVLGQCEEFCGGTLAGGRFVAYTSFPEFEAVGPPGDDVTSNGGMHLLPRAPNVTIPSGEMTVEKCVAACTNFPGYNTSAGLTAGDECCEVHPASPLLSADRAATIGCGDYSVTPSVPAPCGTRCTGNGREICGGDSSMAIYSNPITVLPQYLTFFGNWSLQGCFVTGGPHLLPTKATIIPDGLHARKCIDSCWSFTSAGMEAGNECWCGNITYTVAPGVMTPMSECNSRCSDESSLESCGGVNRLQLYKFDSKF